MSSYEFSDQTSIIQFGLESQRNVADINTVATEIIKKREFDGVLACFKELLSISGDVDMNELLKKERRLDALGAELMKQRIELAKEGKLLQELRNTNDAYILELDDEIKYANDYLKNTLGKMKKTMEVRVMIDILKKRTYELMTSKTVATSFSAQIKLSEDNCFSMSDRAWSAAVTILPLLRGRISMEANQTAIERAQQLLRDNMIEMEAKVK
ncbi:MAG: hypothetical protein J6Z22_09980 [Lachnospiraceae bacterium]|nr:hypothetical protein [Lachnospiraceae bacterium]